jgi:molybdopterin molybdotransferase
MSLQAATAATGENCWPVAHLRPISEARELVLAAARRLPAESVGLEDGLGRVLAEDVRSPLDVPPFDSSAMDGFALVAGRGGELPVIAEARAGHPAAERVEPGTAVRISTGAPVPEGADAVVPIELTEAAPAGVRVPETARGENVRRAGEDVRRGELVLSAGTELGAAELGVLASLGLPGASCARRPLVALIVTGDELAEPGEPLAAGRIFSSNAYALAAQVAAAGGTLLRRETVADDAADTRSALERALADADVVCASGGVSVGPHDHVKGALRELGVEERFWGVRLKPGKPTWFGVRDETLVFGLPGNPVSAMVTFQLFARPALRALQGATPDSERATAVLDEPVGRNPRREQAVRVRLRPDGDGWHAATTGDQGSHILTSMLGARGLALIPSGEGELAAGERVEVELL